MSNYVGVALSDPWLQSQFTQVELRALQSKFLTSKEQSGCLAVHDLPPLLQKLKDFSKMFTEDDIKSILDQESSDQNEEIDFESFLRAYLNVQAQATAKLGSPKNASSFLKTATTTFHHSIKESEKAAYVSHINNFLGDDPFLKEFLPLDPFKNDIFNLAKDGVLLCKLINVAVPGTIDERAINTKRFLNPWERNENHMLCLNSSKAIGCTVVNIGSQDLAEARPHLVLGLISQIIKIQSLADLSLKKTPQLVQLVDGGKDTEELLSLTPEKVLLKWMNFHLKKAGYKKEVTNFSSDVKDGEAYTYLLNALAPEHAVPPTLHLKDPVERAKMVIKHAEKLDCRRFLAPHDITDGSPNLNLAFCRTNFQASVSTYIMMMHTEHLDGCYDDANDKLFLIRNGLLTDVKTVSFAEMMTDDVQTSREERCYRLWINSLGVPTYVNNLFEDVRDGWVLLEVLDKVSPGSVNWKLATRPPIRLPFAKVGNCNEVIQIGKRLNFSLVNVAGSDIMQGNKKLILAFLWQLMRFHMLQLLKKLRSCFHGKEITDADILRWANNIVKQSGRTSQIESFKDKRLSSGIFFLELLSAVEPRVVNWSVITEGESIEEKKLNATYIISVARKLGCSIFLLPEDIIEVNPKMMMTLTASIMHQNLKQPSIPTNIATDTNTTDYEAGSAFENPAVSAAEASPTKNGDASGAHPLDFGHLTIEEEPPPVDGKGSFEDSKTDDISLELECCP